MLSGSDAVAIAGETANPVYSLIVKPQIQHFAELKGKTLGLSLPVDTISISMRKLLALKGLGEADYSVKELVGTPVRFDCLKRGECDGGAARSTRGFRRYGGGLPEIGCVDGGSGGIPIPGRCRAPGLGAGGRDAVVRFVRALAAAFRFIRDRANREEVATAIVKLTGSPDQIARQTLALYFEPERGVLPKQAEIDLNGLTQVIAFMGEGGAIKPPLPQPERFVDLQYLRAAGVQ